jgi:hypothetical protein
MGRAEEKPMKARYTWSLVILFGALVGVFQYTDNLELQKQIQIFEAKKFFPGNHESVSRIKIIKRDGDPIEAVVNEKDEWSISEPHAFIPANPVLWTQLSQVAMLFINERSIEKNPTDLEAFGLDNPILEVELTIDNTDHRFQFGHPDPTKNNRYTRKDGGEIFLMPAQIGQAFFRELDDVRDKRIMPRMAEGINKIIFERYESEDTVNGNPLLEPILETYEADGEGIWNLTTPEEAYAHQNKLLHLVQQLQFNTAKDHIDDPESLSDFGLEHPWAKVTAFNQEDGQSQTVLFGWDESETKNAGTYATVEGTPIVFTVPSDVIKRLPARPSDFRESRLMTRQASELSSITYKDRRNEITLIQDDQKGWILDSPTPVKMDNIAVSTFIAVLLRVQGESFPKSVPADAFAPPRMAFTMVYTDGTTEEIQIGGIVPESDPIQFYAKQDFGKFTTIPLTAFSLLQSDPFKFQDKHVFRSTKDLVTGMDITVDDTHFHFEKSDQLWKLTQPANIQMSSLADAGDLLDILLDLEAAGIVDPLPDQEIMGLIKPIASLGITTTRAGNEQTNDKIEIGQVMARNSRLRFAQTSNTNEFLYVDQNIIDDIGRILAGFRAK